MRTTTWSMGIAAPCGTSGPSVSSGNAPAPNSHARRACAFESVELDPSPPPQAAAQIASQSIAPDPAQRMARAAAPRDLPIPLPDSTPSPMLNRLPYEMNEISMNSGPAGGFAAVGLSHLPKRPEGGFQDLPLPQAAFFALSFSSPSRTKLS